MWHNYLKQQNLGHEKVNGNPYRRVIYRSAESSTKANGFNCSHLKLHLFTSLLPYYLKDKCYTKDTCLEDELLEMSEILDVF